MIEESKKGKNLANNPVTLEFDWQHFLYSFKQSYTRNTRVFHDFQFSQGDCLFDIFMGVEVHDEKMESSLLGASQV